MNALLRTAVTAAIIGFTAMTVVATQNALPAFEVAWIKPNTSGPQGMGAQFLPGGRFTASGATLWALILMAYRVAPFQIEVPKRLDWVSETLYEVDAKADPAVFSAGPLNTNSIHQIELMLQALLAERFHLSLRHEMRPLSAYALVVGKNGPRLQPAPSDRNCASVPSPCGLRGGRAAGIQGLSVDMSQVAQILSGFVGQPVFDETGLTDRFDIRIPPFIEGAQGSNSRRDSAADSALRQSSPCCKMSACALSRERHRWTCTPSSTPRNHQKIKGWRCYGEIGRSIREDAWEEMIRLGNRTDFRDSTRDESNQETIRRYEKTNRQGVKNGRRIRVYRCTNEDGLSEKTSSEG
jgi:uncharacterized protein (TIGR03435 family)